MSFLFSYISVDFGFTLKIRNRQFIYQNFIWYCKSGKHYKALIYEETDALFPDVIFGCGFLIIRSSVITGDGKFVYLNESILKMIASEYLRSGFYEIIDKEPNFHNEYSVDMPEKVVLEPITRRNRVFGTFFLLSSLISLITALLNGSRNLKSSLITFLSSLFLVISLIFVIPFISNYIKRLRQKHSISTYSEKCKRILLANEFERRVNFREYSGNMNLYTESCFRNSLLSFLKNRLLHEVTVIDKEFIPETLAEYENFANEMRLVFRKEVNKFQKYLHAMLERMQEKPSKISVYEKLIEMKNVEPLSIPVGRDENDEICYLNLSDGYDGPHMLICGTTGSGKSEFIISYLLFLFTVYSPKELSVCIIDFKGGATAAVFHDFPHVVGISTDLDEIGLKRCMSSIRLELKKREEAFKKVSEELLIPSLNSNLYRSLYEKGKVSTPIPELFIVIDEFAELRSLYPKYLDELIMISRIGRSLGIHLILICQQVTGCVDRNILFNTGVRIAFRLLSESESYEVTSVKDAYRLDKTGEFVMRCENSKKTQKLLGFYSKDNYKEQKIVKCSNGKIISAETPKMNDLFTALTEEIQRRKYEKAPMLWNNQYVFTGSNEILAIETISDSDYLLLNKELLMGKTMILESIHPDAIRKLMQCLFHHFHTDTYYMSEKENHTYGMWINTGSEYEMYILFSNLLKTERSSLLFVESMDVFSECNYKLFDMFLSILGGKNRNVFVCMFKRPKSSLLGSVLRNTDFIFGYDEKSGKYVNETSQLFLNENYPVYDISEDEPITLEKKERNSFSIGILGENLKELVIDPCEITELFIISHRTDTESFLRHLKEAFTSVKINIVKLNTSSSIEDTHPGIVNIYTCHDDKSLLLREISERQSLSSKIIYYGKGFSQCSAFYDRSVTQKPVFMPSDAKEAYLLTEDEAILFFPYGKEESHKRNKI